VPETRRSGLSGNGAKEAFIYTSGKLGVDWTAEARQAVTEFGMTPFFYQGLEKAHEGTSISDEAHRDLWDCDVIIAAITEEEAQNAAALWIYGDIEVAVRRGVPCLLYVRSAANGTFGNWPENAPHVAVLDQKDFGRELRNDLTRLRFENT